MARNMEEVTLHPAPRGLAGLSTPAPATSSPPPAGLGSFRLYCFQVVVEEGGFKRATARLHVTQPALSYQIKQLEEELGTQLFHRRPGGVSPTQAGHLLFRHAQQVSAALREAQLAIKELSDGAAGEVRIGSSSSIGVYFLPQLLLTMRERYPAIRASVQFRKPSAIADALLTRDLDLALLADPHTDHRLRFETLFEERVSLVCGRTHPFFGRPALTPEQLQGAQFVSLSKRTSMGAMVQDYLDRLGITGEPVATADNVETIKRMVELGLGVAFLPDMVIERDVVCEERPDGRLSRSLVEPALHRRIVLARREGDSSSHAVAAFVDEVRRQSKTSRRGPSVVRCAAG